MPRQALMEEFETVLASVRARKSPYVSKPGSRIRWKGYDLAQEQEYPEVIGLIRAAVDQASRSYVLIRKDAAGRARSSADDIAKLLLVQQYEGRSDRVAVGYLNVIGERLGINHMVGYKTLENAYSDYDVMAILNDVFFLTQQPVANLEHEFSIDGTCFNNTIKANWESMKDEILRLSGKGVRSKDRRRRQFDKVMIAAGTTFKVISSFAVTSVPTANESPYLRPLFKQIVKLYGQVLLMTADAAFISEKGELLGHSFSGSPS